MLAPLPNAVGIDRNPQTSERKATQVRPRNEALKKAKTALIEFATSPFPYDGMVPDKDTPFLDVVAGEPRSVETAPALSNSFGFGGHNATLIFV